MYLNEVIFCGDVVSEVKSEVFKGEKGELTKHTVNLCHKGTWRGKVKLDYATVVAWGNSGLGLNRAALGDNVFVKGHIKGTKFVNQSSGVEKIFMEIGAREVAIMPRATTVVVEPVADNDPF